MKNVPILGKFLSVLALLSLVALIAVGYMAFQLKQTADNGAKIADTTMQAALDVANGTEQIQHARADMLSLEISLKSEKNTFFSESLAEDLVKFNRSLRSAETLVPEDAEQIETIRMSGNALFSDVCSETTKLASTSTTQAEKDVAQQAARAHGCLAAFPPYVVSMVNFRNGLIEKSKKQYIQLGKDTVASLTLSVCGLVFAIIIVGILSYLVVKKYIILPLDRLGNVMRRLASGDLTTKVPEIDRRDEIGKMAKIVMVFQQSGLEKERLEQQALHAQMERETEQKKREEERARVEAEQEIIVNSLADGLEHLSSGNLVFRIENEFAKDYEKLRVDFNQAMDRLQKTMRHIVQNATSVESSAVEITQSADDMSRRTEQQAAGLEQTAAALDEITVTIKKSSEGMREAHELVNEAKTNAERSGMVVTKTITAMSTIEDSSKKVSNIIGIIDEIAFQTNLLALNAGVEAARAGEAGRGFAVVATEVRALAQRSADAAKEIKGLIRESGLQVQTGVKLVNETGISLSRIVDQVARLNILITNAASSAKEQATAVSEVNSTMNQMDQSTQKNAAMAEESTAASHALAREAEGLQKLVSQFRIESRKVKEFDLA